MYVFPHKGQTAVRLSSRFILHLLDAASVGFEQDPPAEPECVVSLEAGPHISVRGNADRTISGHDIDKCLYRPLPARSESPVGDPYLLPVVKVGVSFVAVQPEDVLVPDFPHGDRNLRAGAGIDGQVRAGLAPAEGEAPVSEDRSPQGSRRRAAELHLFRVQVASVSDVVVFCHIRSSFPRGKLPFYRLKAARGGRWGAVPCSGGHSAVAEGRVAGKVFREDLAGGGELVADEAQPEEPAPHGVLFVVGDLDVRAGGSDLLRHLAQGEAQLDVGLQPAGVDPALFPVVGLLELVKPELDRLSEYSGKRSYPNKIFIRRL